MIKFKKKNAHAFEFQTDILRPGIYFNCIFYFPHQRRALNKNKTKGTYPNQ